MMTRKEKADFVAQQLEELFPKIDVPLHHTSPYTLLIAVLLSAQCTDARVNKVTPILFELADTPQKMIALAVEDIETVIRSCGLAPRKSKAIHGLSKILLEKHNGVVPKSLEALEELPGVGHKTASVVVSQAFGIPAFPVDTHIHRLAERWTLSTGQNVVKTETDLKKLFPKEHWNKRHIQIILFGRAYCPARGHNPYACPICSQIGRKTMFAQYDKIRKQKQKN